MNLTANSLTYLNEYMFYKNEYNTILYYLQIFVFISNNFRINHLIKKPKKNSTNKWEKVFLY